MISFNAMLGEFLGGTMLSKLWKLRCAGQGVLVISNGFEVLFPTCSWMLLATWWNCGKLVGIVHRAGLGAFVSDGATIIYSAKRVDQLVQGLDDGVSWRFCHVFFETSATLSHPATMDSLMIRFIDSFLCFHSC